MTATDLTALAARLRLAAAAYYDTAMHYDTDAELMTDAQYDDGIEQLRIAVAEDPVLAPQFTDLLDQVAAGTSSGGDVVHSSLMGSMDKVVGLDAVADFVDALAAEVVVEPKLDGLALRAEYSGGALVTVSTRGDGSSGEDVTNRVLALQVAGLPVQTSGEPHYLTGPGTGLEVRGEVFVTDEAFVRANAIRTEAGQEPFVNQRNAAAGILRKGSADYAGILSFAAYEAAFDADSAMEHTGRLAAVARAGITTVHDLVRGLVTSPTGYSSDVLARIECLGDNRASLGFPIDGAIIKADSNAARAMAGYGSRAPKWAIAFKYEAETATTQVVAIETAVGRTGRLSIRVELDPVFVGGTTVTYATGHNVSWMLERDIRVGDTVTIKRAGDVIPYLEAVDPALRPADSEPWAPPETDPNGGEWDKTTLLWRSTDPSLSVGALIRYAVSRDALDVEGMGTEIVESLVEQGLVADIADLFDLTGETLTTLTLSEGRMLGAKNAAKIVAEIERAKGAAWNRVITALGIRMTGRTMGRRLAAALPTLDQLRSASVEVLAAVDGIGPKKADAIRAGLDDLETRGVLDRLVAAGINTGTEPEVADTSSLPLAGMTVVVSGSVPGYSRTTVAEFIESLGGKASSSVSAATSLLVSEPSTSSKYMKAQDAGVQIVTPAEFLAMIS